MEKSEKLYLTILHDRREGQLQNDLIGDGLSIEMGRNGFRTRDGAIAALRSFHRMHQAINPGSTRYEYYIREITYSMTEEKIDLDNQDGEK